MDDKLVKAEGVVITGGVTIKDIREKMEQELFKAFDASAQLTPAAELRAKPLSKEDFDRFVEEWKQAMNDPKDPPKIYSEQLPPITKAEAQELVKHYGKK